VDVEVVLSGWGVEGGVVLTPGVAISALLAFIAMLRECSDALADSVSMVAL